MNSKLFLPVCEVLHCLWNGTKSLSTYDSAWCIKIGNFIQPYWKPQDVGCCVSLLKSSDLAKNRERVGLLSVLPTRRHLGLLPDLNGWNHCSGKSQCVYFRIHAAPPQACSAPNFPRPSAMPSSSSLPYSVLCVSPRMPFPSPLLTQTHPSIRNQRSPFNWNLAGFDFKLRSIICCLVSVSNDCTFMLCVFPTL